MVNEIRRLPAFRHMHALCVSVDVSLGEYTYGKAILESIDEFTKSSLIPVYTFAEDIATDVGFLTLLGGKEITANPFSVVGDIGAMRKLFILEKLLQKLNLSYKHFPTGREDLLQTTNTNTL